MTTSAIFAGAPVTLRQRATSPVFAGPAVALRQRATSATFTGDTGALPPVRVGTPFRFVRDASITTRGSPPFRFVRDAAITPRPSTPFRWVRGVIFPLRNYSGPTGGQMPALVPLQIYGGSTGEVAVIGPQTAHGGVTGGEVFFTGASPAVRLTANGVAPNTIELAWVNVGGEQTDYRIERSLNGQGAWEVIATVPVSVLLYLDLTVTNLVVYDYRVISFNSNNEAPPSNIAMAFAPPPGGAPPPGAPPVAPPTLEFLSPGVYGLETDLDGNVAGNKF